MISISTCRRIIKDKTGFRAGTPASRELALQLEEQAVLIAEIAGKLAWHNGRRTVSCEDIRLAVEILGGE